MIDVELYKKHLEVCANVVLDKNGVDKIDRQMNVKNAISYGYKTK